MKHVTLLQAYFWNCENCGAGNYGMPIQAEFGPNEKEEAYRSIHELSAHDPLPDDWQCFMLVTIPTSVVCKECRSTFLTIDDRTSDI